MSNTAQTSRVVTVTPKLAADWLRRQKNLVAADAGMKQRNVKEEKVQLYAKDMAENRWQMNGEPLIFASNGRILDGQHRLLACVQAEESFRTLVVENVGHEAMRTIDTGIVRTMGDQLTIGGMPHGSNLATALGVLYRWEATGHKGFDWRARATRLELWDVLGKHPEITKFVSQSGRLKTLMSVGLGAALWYVFDQQDSVLAGAFFEALMSGSSLMEDDPVFMLRERLIREKQLIVTRRSKLTMSMDSTTEYVYRAWDATRRGVKIAKLQRGKSDRSREILRVRVSTEKSKKGGGAN